MLQDFKVFRLHIADNSQLFVHRGNNSLNTLLSGRSTTIHLKRLPVISKEY